MNDLAGTLRDQGNKVVIATGKPNYPDGKIYDGYRSSTLDREWFRGDIEVNRVPLRPRGRAGARELVANYLSFVFSGIRYFPRLLKKHDFDVILVFAPSPITAAIPAVLLKYRKRAHLAIWIQDLWPESLDATGFIRNRLLLAMVGWMVRLIYWFSDTLLVQSRAFVEPVSRYTKRSKVIYFPNSLLDPGKSAPEGEGLPESLVEVLKNNFCLVFAGNVGSAQSVETIAALAEGVSDLKGFRVVVVGSGSRLKWLEDEKHKRGLKNLVLAGRFPAAVMPRIYALADALLVTLSRKKIFAYTIPSKVQSYLAASRPVIASVDGEGARIIDEAGAGLTGPAEDVESLIHNVRKLVSMDDRERREMGESGREYYLKHFEMGAQCRQLMDILSSRCAQLGEAK